MVFIIRWFLENKLRLPQYFLNDLQRIYETACEGRLPTAAQSAYELTTRGVKNSRVDDGKFESGFKDAFRGTGDWV